MVLYIIYNNIIWTVIISALCGGGAVAAFFLIRNKRKGAADGSAPSAKNIIVEGIKNNAPAFNEMYEPVYNISVGKTMKKEEVFAQWCERVASTGDEAFIAAFNQKFGIREKWKKDKHYILNANKLCKLFKKAGIVREGDIYVTADETTPIKYELVGMGSIEAGVTYDVLAPYWHIDEDIVDKGVIR